MLKTRIKASSITNLTDARYFAAWEVSWLGFDLSPGSDYFIEPAKVLALKEWVEGPDSVGQFGLQSAEEITHAAETLQLDFVQVSMFTDESVLKQLKGIKVIKEIIIEHEDAQDDIEYHINQFAPFVKVFLIDFSKNEYPFSSLSAETKDYLKELCKQHKIILSIDIQPTELEEILDHIQPHGLQVKGGEEEKVGLKSFDELDLIFEALEILV